VGTLPQAAWGKWYVHHLHASFICGLLMLTIYVNISLAVQICIESICATYLTAQECTVYLTRNQGHRYWPRKLMPGSQMVTWVLRISVMNLFHAKILDIKFHNFSDVQVSINFRIQLTIESLWCRLLSFFTYPWLFTILVWRPIWCFCTSSAYFSASFFLRLISSCAASMALDSDSSEIKAKLCGACKR